jgi:uncharacterized protein (TIGR02246 family)
MKLTENDLQEINALRSAITEAILNGNADKMADLCMDDVYLLHPDTDLIEGKKAMRDHEAEILKFVRVAKLKLTPVVINGDENIAYEVGTQEVEIHPPDERFSGKRKYVHILKRGVDAKWRFSVLMSNNN